MKNETNLITNESFFYGMFKIIECLCMILFYYSHSIISAKDWLVERLNETNLIMKEPNC